MNYVIPSIVEVAVFIYGVFLLALFIRAAYSVAENYMYARKMREHTPFAEHFADDDVIIFAVFFFGSLLLGVVIVIVSFLIGAGFAAGNG